MLDFLVLGLPISGRIERASDVEGAIKLVKSWCLDVRLWNRFLGMNVVDCSPKVWRDSHKIHRPVRNLNPERAWNFLSDRQLRVNLVVFEHALQL